MPIAMRKDEWDRIYKWTKYDAKDPEVVRRREYVKYLDATSRVMTKSWPNSLENVNKRNEELRLARNLQAEQINSKFYARYLRKKKEKQAQLMYSARDMVFKNKDAPKLLLSAVIETVVQKEREVQVKFLNERRREEAERKRQDDDDIIRRAKEWHELMALRKKRRWDVNKQHQKDILDQAHEVADRNRVEYETELNLQKIDNIKANEQMETLKEFDEQFKAEERARIFTDIETSRKETNDRKREQDAREKMDDKLIEVLQKSRCKIEQRRRQTVADLKNEKLRLLEKISQRLESGDTARAAKERAILDKAVKEKNDISLANEARIAELEYAISQINFDIIGIAEARRLGYKIEDRGRYLLYYYGETKGEKGVGFLVKKQNNTEVHDFIAISERAAVLQLLGFTQSPPKPVKKAIDAANEVRLQALKKKEEQFREDRKASREKFLRDEEQRLHEFNTTRQWDIMNRFKNVELCEDFQKNLRKEKERKIAEYRAEILRLWKERDDREAKERADSRYFYGELAEQKLRDADNKLLTHAAGLLQEAKEHGRPDYALHRAIDAYCKLYRLYPMPNLPKSVQAHFKSYAPWDGSRPAAAGREPPARSDQPGPARSDQPGPARSDQPGPAPPKGKTDGLQAVDKAGPSKPMVEKKEENADYKRATPANGLQRRNLQQTYTLPPISAVACTAESRRCALKPGVK